MQTSLLLKSKQIKLEFPSEPTKYKKYHKIKHKVFNSSLSTKLNQGATLYFTSHKNLTLKQILVILKLLRPRLKNIRTSRVLMQIKLDTILTKKPKDIRMGRGKGAPSEKVFILQAGRPLFTLFGLSSRDSKIIISESLPKLPDSLSLNKYKW